MKIAEGARAASLAASLTLAVAGFSAGHAWADEANGLARTCNGCHGPDGVSATPTMPSLAGLDTGYLATALRDYAAGTRSHYLMEIIAKGLQADEMAALARIFSATPFQPTVLRHDPVLAARGQAAGAVCRECHGEDLRGKPNVPRIAGQPAAYLLQAMRDYRDGRRRAAEGAMQSVASLSDEELEALAHYAAGVD